MKTLGTLCWTELKTLVVMGKTTLWDQEQKL